MVHQVLVAQLTLIAEMVMYAVPRLKADKRSLLAVGSPHAYARSAELNAYLSLARNWRKDVDGMYLALVKDDGVVLEVFLRKCPQSCTPSRA